MKRPDFPIVWAMASGLAGAPALADGPTPDKASRPLTAVLRRESYVFASTPAGLFRASLATKRWERLATPPGMVPGGKFAAEPGPTPLVVYVTPPPGWFEPAVPPGARHGLYLSRDDGATWDLTAERDDLAATLLHPNGQLFAIAGARKSYVGHRLLLSPDLGRTWRDITGTVDRAFMGLDVDPFHPSLVRIHAWAIRPYTFTAEDENYRWRIHPGEPERPPGRRPSAEFFDRSIVGSSCWMYPATLSNYFERDFGDGVAVPGLEVGPRAARPEFARGARVVVPIRVVSLPGTADPAIPAPAIKLIDRPGELDFWGLRVETADAQGWHTLGTNRGRMITVTTTSTPDGGVVTTTDQPPLIPHQAFDLGPGKPYEREVDLSRLADFSRPGEYRVQLSYFSAGHSDRERGEWDGSFDGPPFTVRVRE